MVAHQASGWFPTILTTHHSTGAVLEQKIVSRKVTQITKAKFSEVVTWQGKAHGWGCDQYKVRARGNSQGKVSNSGNAPSKDLTVHNDVSAFVFPIQWPRSYSSRKAKMVDPYKPAQKWNMTSSVKKEYYGFKEHSNLNL